MMTAVGPPGGLAMLRCPSTAPTRSLRPANPLEDVLSRIVGVIMGGGAPGKGRGRPARKA